MHFKLILATTEIVLIVMGLLTFAYTVYAMYSDTTANTTGAAVVKAHQYMLYVNLVIQLLQFAVAGLLVYKV